MTNQSAIAYQQHKIAELERDNRLLAQDNAELRQMLAIALRKHYRSSTLVISPDDLREPSPKITLESNIAGDMLIKIVGV